MEHRWIFPKKTIYILIGIFIIYTIIGFFVLPIISKNIIQNKLGKILNRQVTIEKLSINPFTLSAQINSFNIKKNKVLFSADEIYINFSIASVFALSPVVSDILIKNPYINIIRNKNGAFNFSDILDAYKIKESASKGDKNLEDKDSNKAFNFTIENFKVSQGRIRVTDRVAQVSHIIKNLSIILPFISNKIKYRHKKSNLYVNFVLNKAKFKIDAGMIPFADEPSANIDIKSSYINMVHYLPYLPVPANTKINSLGLNFDIHADLSRKNTRNFLFVKGKIKILNADVNGIHGDNIISLPLLSIDLLRSDILTHKFNISDFLVKSPKINLVRDNKGRINLLKYLQSNESMQNTEKQDKKDGNLSFAINLKNFKISNALVRFRDDSAKKIFSTEVFPLNININDLKTIIKNENTKASGNYKINLSTKAGEKLASSGNFHIDSLNSAAEGILKISNLAMNKYEPYYANFINADISDGEINMATKFAISHTCGKSDAKLDVNEFSIHSLKMFSPGLKEKFIDIPELKIQGTAISLKNREIDIKCINAENGKIFLKRLKNGKINLAEYLLSQDEKKSASPKNHLVIHKNNVPVKHAILKTNKAEKSKKLLWKINVNSFNINGFNLKFKDLTNKQPVLMNCHNISIKGGNFDNYSRKECNILVNTGFNDKGHIEIKGNFVPSLLKSNLFINFKNIDIKSLQPYFTDSIRVIVTDGYIQAKGRLLIHLGRDNRDYIGFTGQTSVNNFICLDKQSAHEFFKCKSLYLAGINASVFPVKIAVKNISLTDFYSRIAINKKGQINLSTIFKTNIDKKNSRTGMHGKNYNSESNSNIGKKNLHNKPAFKIQNIGIKNVTLQGGCIVFSDYSINPGFKADMKKITGSLKGLSSNENSRAVLHLQGIHGQYSPLEITGKINPLAKKKFADINISFKDIELSKFTPYSAKYLGYKIDKGKLDLNLKYLIIGNKLISDNRIKLDDLSLGDRVKSDKATSLPISLAITLLKNRKGQIDLDLPVKGQLNDPKFKIGSIVLGMISNLIIKVVTSPFSIIGSMFGGGEELAFINFKYGSSDIDPANYKKIDTIADILRDKPSIKLGIRGFYDKINDYEALKIKKFNNMLKAEKLKRIFTSGEKAKTLNEVYIKPQEKDSLIEALYSKAKFPKPMTDKGREKQISIKEKRKLLITNININKNDLRFLAMKRSENVKAYLISKDKISKKRIFLLEPEYGKGGKAINASQVRFSLK